MAIYKGDKKVIALYKGDKPILKRYKGTELIYELKTNNETLSFEWSGTSTSQTFKINSTSYTASTNPYTTTLTDLGIEDFTSAYNMFSNCTAITAITSIPDTSNVTNMFSMFYGCRSLTSLNLSNWNTSNVTTMQYMFNNCRSLTSLDISNFDTSNVTDMGNMFGSCSSLKSLDLSSFDTSKVTIMYNMFNDCNNLTSLDLSNFNTSNVTNMSWMFYGCSSLSSLDLSNFDTSKVTSYSNMFKNCNSLTSISMYGCNCDTIKFIADRLIDASIISSYAEAPHIIQTDNIDCLEDGTLAPPEILGDCYTPINVLYVNPEIYSQYATSFSGYKGARFDTIDCGQGEFIYIPRNAQMGDIIEINGRTYTMDGIELIDGIEYNVFNFINIVGEPLYLAYSTVQDMNRYRMQGIFYYQ